MISIAIVTMHSEPSSEDQLARARALSILMHLYLERLPVLRAHRQQEPATSSDSYACPVVRQRALEGSRAGRRRRRRCGGAVGFC